MGYREMRKPLLQSAVVLLAVLLIIGFVAGSGAESIFGGIFSIFKGILYTILFAFALVIALIISVVFLIAVLLGGVALYSPDSAREMFFRLRNRATMLFSSWTDILEPTTGSAETQDEPVSPARKEEDSSSPRASGQNTQPANFTELNEIKKQIVRIIKESESAAASLTSVQDQLAAIPVAEIVRRTEQMEVKQEELKSKLEQCLEKLEQVQARAESGIKNAEDQSREISSTRNELKDLSTGLAELRTDLKQLHESGKKEETSLSVDEGKYRIFTYLDQENDKSLFAKLIAQAVEKNMTYAEIDGFLTKKLPEKLDSIIKDHPSLTKEYIRDCRSN